MSSFNITLEQMLLVQISLERMPLEQNPSATVLLNEKLEEQMLQQQKKLEWRSLYIKYMEHMFLEQ